VITVTKETRMVQLPATAAIEYVSAGHFFPGGLLAGGIFVREGFCPEDLDAMSRLSVPSIVA